MIPAVITDPASGQPVVVASLERQRIVLEKEVKAACNEFLNEPDWDKNMSIVDQLNRAPYLCPFAIKEIRAQLKSKNPEIEILALQLTETIIKNCPSSHAAVAQQDFMRYVVKVGTDQRQGGKWTQLKTKMKKKNQTINSKHVRSQCIEKALLILKMLSIAYSDSNLYPVFRATVRQLEGQKVRFPETNKDESLNVFSPIHSSNAQQEYANQPTALGSVQNPNLQMIRPVVMLETLTNLELIQAQEQAQFLFTMINAPVLSYELIPDLTQMLNNSQQAIVIMISEGNGDEDTLMQALQVNDIVNQVLEDAQAIANGTKRRYQEEVDVAALMLQQSDSDKKNADHDDDDLSLERSISIGHDEEMDKDLLKLSAPSQDKLAKKRGSKTKSKKKATQSMDLLGMDEKNGGNLMSAVNGSGQSVGVKKKESEENILDFLGVQNEQNVHNDVVNDVFDPLGDAQQQPRQQPLSQSQSHPPSRGQPQPQSQPPPAFSGPNYGNFNNGNVFREKKEEKGPGLNKIERGNASVLNVLTGEPSPSQSYGASTESSQKQTPHKQPKQQYNIGGNKADAFDTGNDPFADFGGGGGKLFDDKPKVNASAVPPQPQPQPPKQQENIFAPMNNTYKTQSHPQPTAAPPKKRDSNKIILDMFVGAGDVNINGNVSQPQPVPVKDVNPFGGAAVVDSNPFDALDNPFGSDIDNVGSDDVAENPFDLFGAAPTQPVNVNNNKKKPDDFMSERDPFADM